MVAKNFINKLNFNDEIIIYCAAGYGEEILLKLISLGYNIVCFCDNAKRNEGSFLLGVPVYNYQKCCLEYPDAVYVIANSTYATALEIGLELEQDGYIKNLSYYISIELELQGLLSDEKEGIREVLKNQVLILFGNLFLCELFEKWAYNFINNSKTYICHTENEIDSYKRIYPDALWIPLEKGFTGLDIQKNELLVQLLQKHNICLFSRFFLSHMVYCEEFVSVHNNCQFEDFKNTCGLQVKKVLFLKTSSFSGSLFIDSLLDSHPNILYLGISGWSLNIWYIIKSVIKEPEETLTEAIISKISECAGNVVLKLEDYKSILKKYIKPGKEYSERDLFLIIHLVNYELLYGNIPKGEAIIYMDIHENMIMRNSIFKWLEQMGFEVILLEMLRNPYKRFGSAIKWERGINQGTINSSIIYFLLYMMSGSTMDEIERKYDIIRIRFEDLKTNPEQILEKLCHILEIPWSNTLLQTTLSGKESVYVSNGEKITGFDLKPVYHTYDEYFDTFDKFRLDLLFREKSKAYGYSYIDRDKYPGTFEEMAGLFRIPFCFEKYISFKDEADKARFHKKMELLCTQLLILEENKDKYPEYFQFGSYLELGDSNG